MKEKVWNTIQKYHMLSKGERVLVALSGGKDSVALLHLLHAFAPALSLELIAVHIHHGIRGEEADRDEQFSRALCARLGIAFESFRFDVPQLAKSRGIGEEACGRQVRYEVFARFEADKIATAHTLSDSVETMLFHLCRGSGVKGICGIPPVRDNIIRPLIECTGEEVLRYLAENELEFVCDSTNEAEEYSRNVIRKRVVPALLQINPAAEQHIGATIRALNEQNESIGVLAQAHLDAFANDAAQLLRLPPAVRHEAVRRLCLEHTGVVPERKHMIAIDKALATQTSLQINSGAIVRVRGGKLEFPKAPVNAAFSFVVEQGEYTLPIGILKAEVLNCKQFENLVKDRFSFYYDCDKMIANPICRNRQAGDRFYDGKRALSKSMKQYLNEIAFPPEKRAAFPVFVSGKTIIGTLGAHPAKAFAPDAQSKNIMYISLKGDYDG